MGVYHFSVFRKQFRKTQRIVAIHIETYVKEGKHNPPKCIPSAVPLPVFHDRYDEAIPYYVKPGKPIGKAAQRKEKKRKKSKYHRPISPTGRSMGQKNRPSHRSSTARSGSDSFLLGQITSYQIGTAAQERQISSAANTISFHRALLTRTNQPRTKVHPR